MEDLKLSSDSIPTEPTDDAREVFEQRNPLETQDFLYHKLCIQASLPIHITAGVVTVMHACFPFWERTNTPSIFSHLPHVSTVSINDIRHSGHNFSLSLNASNSRDGIDCENIRTLTKKKSTINGLEHRLIHVIYILSIFFGNQSFLVSQILDCQKHIQKNQSAYC